MKFQKLFLALALSVAFVSNAHAQEPDPTEGRIIIAVNTDWGVGYFTDANGKLLFKKQFEKVDKFFDGLARVKLNGKYGYINLSGELVVPCVYDVIYSFSEDLAAVKNGGKWGFINRNCELVVQYLYDGVRSFSKGVAQVKANDKYGLINTSGEILVPCVCEYIAHYSEDVAWLIIDGKPSYVNLTTGAVSMSDPVHIPDISVWATENFTDDFFASVVIDDNDKYGYEDAFGELVIPCIYDDAYSFSGGFAAVKVGGKWGFINTCGEVIVPCIYDEVANVSEGFAKVKYGNKYGFINTDGEEVVPCIYDFAHFISDGFIEVRKNRKYGVVNSRGEVILPCIYDDVYSCLCSPYECVFMVKEGEVYKVINKDGKVVVKQCMKENISWSVVK